MNQKIKEQSGAIPFIFVLCLVFFLSSCSKEKLDFEKDNRYNTEKAGLSNIRIVNLGRFNQLILNGDSLTNFIYKDPQLELPEYPATPYFPKGGRLGEIWTVPQALLNKEGSAEVGIRFKGILPQAGELGDPEFSVQQAGTQPMDYYVLEKGLLAQSPWFAAIPRAITQPSKPDHFKIRLINLMARPIDNYEGREDLVGPITLAYADGSAVSTQTSGITPEQRVSDYVELPYGTYQFKVLNAADGRQIPGSSAAADGEKTMDMRTSAIASGYEMSTNLHYAPVRTYQPGGVYTIVVSPRSFVRHASPVEVRGDALQNAFKVIADIDEPVNQTYARIQPVNALTGQPVLGFRIGGKTWVEGLAYGSASEYVNRVSGSVRIDAVDAGGKVLVSTEALLRPAQNYSVWCHPDAAGKPVLTVIANDLSGNVYQSYGVSEDASQSRIQLDFFFWYRFLNMSQDNPYISFTYDNGQPISGGPASANYNLQPGEVRGLRPYASGGYRNPFSLQVYRSAPAVIPGVWAEDIPVKTGADFIMRPALYESAGRPLPQTEPGIYSVALIGRKGPDVPEAEKTKIMIVKHNK